MEEQLPASLPSFEKDKSDPRPHFLPDFII